MNKRSNGLKAYFKKHHLGKSTVNVDRARYKINRIFDELTNDNIIETIDLLQKEYKCLIVLYKHFDRSPYRDRRTGFETYGYTNIAGDLTYVSDRYMCQFRVRWLIDLVSCVNYEGRLSGRDIDWSEKKKVFIEEIA
jgi:hypothetical protein